MRTRWTVAQSPFYSRSFNTAGIAIKDPKHNETGQLVLACYQAYKQRNGGKLRELCGESTGVDEWEQAILDPVVSQYSFRREWDSVLETVTFFDTGEDHSEFPHYTLLAESAVWDIFDEDALQCTVFARAILDKAPVDALAGLLSIVDATAAATGAHLLEHRVHPTPTLS